MNSPFLSKRIFLFHIFMLICSTVFACAVIKRFDSLREITIHTVIQANEGVPSDIKFTSAATNDSFMLKPTTLNKGNIMAI